MIKLIYCISRKPGMSFEEFSRYWSEEHAPLGARIPGLRRLVQNHVQHHPDDVRAPDFDGVAELWFDDWDALLAARQAPEWRSSGEDEACFIDGSKVAYLVVEEREIGLPGGGQPGGREGQT